MEWGQSTMWKNVSSKTIRYLETALNLIGKKENENNMLWAVPVNFLLLQGKIDWAEQKIWSETCELRKGFANPSWF